jgi:iron complex transport system permease protein
MLILLVAVAGPSELSQIHGWLIGTMQPINLVQLFFLFLLASLPVLFILKNSNQLNLLLFGDEFAKSLGVDPIRLRRSMIFGVCILVSIAVSISGAIGFIGLIVPHFVKKWRRGSALMQCFLSMLIGSSLLIFADMLSRILFSPAQLPIGVFTALLGAPVFCFILLQRRIR